MEYEYEDCTAVGIALLTSAINDPRRFHAAKLVGDFVEDGTDVSVLFVGLVNLAELLLEDLAQATGREQAALLQDLAARLAASTTEEE